MAPAFTHTLIRHRTDTHGSPARRASGTARTALALFAVVGLTACGGEKTAAVQPVARAVVNTPTPEPLVSPSQWREDLRAAYRLRPDARFLLAAGEIDRLAVLVSAPPAKPVPPRAPADAEFADGRWIVRSDGAVLGELPELPDFPDLLALLVAQAKKKLPAGQSSAGADDAPPKSFLMPELVADLQAAEPAMAGGRFAPAARAWARLAFQMPDPIQLAPLIPARALALLAAARSRDPRACVEEETLLASSLGYTRHAERLAAVLPAGSPVRDFVAADPRAIADAASRDGASTTARYLAIRRATSRAEKGAWTEARQRFLPGNDSVAVIATALDIELPEQFEVENWKFQLLAALPRAVVRELSRLPAAPTAPNEPSEEFWQSLRRAADAATGPLWDGTALSHYYEAAYYSSAGDDHSPWVFPGADERVSALNEFWKDQVAPDPHGDTRGAGLVERWVRRRYNNAPPNDQKAFGEIRALVRWLDTRPSHRASLARYGRNNLEDPRLADQLYRSLDATLSDTSRRAKAEAVICLGDDAALHRLLSAPDLSQAEASAILWSWYSAKTQRQAMFAEWDRVLERFPHDWDPTNYYVNALREVKDYRKACRIVERFLERNPGPSTPGYYHAHIRLAHNYALAGEYEKGLELLRGMTVDEQFGHGNQHRGMAECYAGLGQLEEAEKIGRQAVSELPGQTEAIRYLVKILWMRGKYEDAAALAAAPAFGQWEQCDVLRHELPEALAAEPLDSVGKALEAVGRKPALARWWNCATEGFGEAGRFEEAVLVGERIPVSPRWEVDRAVDLYGYLLKSKGREAAAQWLTTHMPRGSRNRFSYRALWTRKYELLWDAIGTPDPRDDPEFVWLARAIAASLTDAAADPHRAELLAYYAAPSDERHHVIARYLLELGPDEDFLRLASQTRDRSEIGYYFAVRAEHDKRYHDACEWHRVSAEYGRGSFDDFSLATLQEWVAMGPELWRLEKKSPATQPGSRVASNRPRS